MALDRRKKLETAERLLTQGHVQAALIELEDVARGSPTDLLTLNRVGDILAKQGRNREAVVYYRQIADRLAQSGFYPKAVAIHKKILRLTPDSVQSIEDLGELYRQQNLAGEARAFLLRAAEIRLQAREFARARGIYEKLVALEPNDPRHRARLAEARAAEGETAKAGHELLALADWLLAHSRPGDAEQTYRRAAELLPQEAGPAIGLARCHEACGRIDAALGHLDEASARGSRAGELAGARVALLARAGRLDDAVAALRGPHASDVPDAAIVEAVRVSLERGEAAAAWERLGPVFGEWCERGGTERVARIYRGLAQLEAQGHLPALERLHDLVDRRGSPAETSEVQRQLVQAYENRSMLSEAKALAERVAASLAREPAVATETPPAANVPASREPDAPRAGSRVATTPAEMEAPAVPLNRTDEEFVSGRLTQAEILDKYGLRDEALRQLREVTQRFPGHVASQERLVEFLRDGASREEMRDALVRLALARRAAGDGDGARRAVAEAGSAADLDEAMRSSLTKLGLIAVRRATPVVEVGGGTRAAAPGKRGVTIDFDSEEGPASEPIVPGPVPVPVAAEPPAAASVAPATPRIGRRGSREPAPDVLGEIEELIGAGDAAEARRRVQALVTLGYEGPTLDELCRRVAGAVEVPASPAPPTPPSAIPGDDDDLAAITAALEAEITSSEREIPSPDPESEESLAEVFAAFRQHVALEVDEADFRTHYDLGIAYKEMGLLDEAIDEFRRVVVGPELRAESFAMLAICHRERQELDEAARCYREAIASSSDDPLVLRNLRYDLAEVLLVRGDRDNALSQFREVLDSDPTFRDVRERVAQLES